MASMDGAVSRRRARRPVVVAILCITHDLACFVPRPPHRLHRHRVGAAFFPWHDECSPTRQDLVARLIHPVRARESWTGWRAVRVSRHPYALLLGLT